MRNIHGRFAALMCGFFLWSGYVVANEGYLTNSLNAVQESNQAGDEYAVLWTLTMGGYASPWLAVEGRYSRPLWEFESSTIDSMIGVYARPVYPLGGGELYGIFGYTEVRSSVDEIKTTAGLSSGAGLRIMPVQSSVDFNIEYLNAVNRDGLTIRMAGFGIVARF